MSMHWETVECSINGAQVIFSSCSGKARMHAVCHPRLDPYPTSTARLRFRQWKSADTALSLALWGDDKVTELIGGPFDKETIEARLAREITQEATHGVQYWPMFLLTTEAVDDDECYHLRGEDSTFVGCCGLRPYSRSDSALAYELGFHLRPTFWGQGLATEAAAAALAHAFGQMGAHVIVAGHNPKNLASAAVIRKLGLTFAREELYIPTGLMHPTYELHRSAVAASKLQERQGGILEVTSTFVPPQLRGQSIASKLAEAAFTYAGTRQMIVRPSCEFVEAFASRNSRYASLVEQRTRLEGLEPPHKQSCLNQRDSVN